MAKRGSYAKGIERREQILDAALQVIAERGYRATSVSELAAAVGLSQTGILHYFGSKEELFIAVLRKRDELAVAAPRGRHPVEAFVDVMRKNAEVPGLVELYAYMSVEASNPQHPAHQFMLDRYRILTELLAGALRAMQDSGSLAPDIDVTSTATALVALADGLQVRWLLDPTIDMAGQIEQFWNQIAGRTEA